MSETRPPASAYTAGQGEAPGASPDSFADQVSQAGSSGDVLASSGIDHRDETVSYADATGRIVRHPLAHWISFTAQQMHGRIRNEISRRAIIEASNLVGDERVAWEADVRRELRSDAVHALAFRHLRAFEAAEALNSSAEPATQEMRERDDAELLALAPAWEAALDLLQRRNEEEDAAVAAAPDEGWPGPAPEGTGPEWDEYLQQKEAWRERHGIIAAENSSSDAATALHEVELRIAGLSAALLASLKLKAHVGQRHDDIGLDWPDNLGAGLARDILALTEARANRADLDHTSLVGLLELGSATVDELRTIRDVADHLGGAAYAHSWGPRYRRRENAYGAPEYNAAGRLAVWIGDALCSVQSAIHEEARKRVPPNMTDREVRLSLLAVTTIDNGDPDETAAFARELLAHAEAERTRG